MRATIDSTGTLVIVPESETEAYALRCFHEKSSSNTPPAICFRLEGIHSPGDVKPAKGSAKPNRFWPFDKDETARIQQGQPPLTRSQPIPIKTGGMEINGADTSDAADAARFRWLLEGNGYLVVRSKVQRRWGVSPCDQTEKNEARLEIDKEMKRRPL
jgi:hypothetical protein